MARHAAWTMTATVLLGALAGCIGKPPEDIDDPLYDPTICDDCCEACWQQWPTPARVEPAYGCGVWDPNATEIPAILCADPVGWPPPMFAPFDARLLWPDCAGCASLAVAARNDGALVVATERGLVIADATREERIEAARLAAAAPSVALDANGLAWYAALWRDDAGVPSVFLGSWTGAHDAWESEHVVSVVETPLLVAATRVDVAALPDGLVLVLTTGEGAWALRYDGAFREPERLTPLGGTALVGAPVSDAKGRVLVPFAFTPHAPGSGLAPLLPPYPSTSLHYASLGTIAGAWTTHGGMIFPHGVTRAPAIELQGGSPSAFVFVDTADNVDRVETWDFGGSWGAPTPWSEGRAASAPAATRFEHRPTVAWWEMENDEQARLVVARTEGGLPVERLPIATAPGEERAALASWRDGRAALGWVDEAGVWAAVEGSWPDTRCSDNAHCTQSLW